ncbi:MAG: hypothetical protein ACI97A_002482 [Planctomycetota bacterium]|jgi:hypothetical protein
MNTYKDESSPKRFPKVLIVVALMIAGFFFLQFKFGYPERPASAELSAGALVYELDLTPL